MIGLEWLRKQKVQRQKLAVGSLVTEAQAASPVPLQGGYLVPAASPTGPQPAAVVEVSGVVSRAIEEAIRKALTVGPRPPVPETRTSNMVTCGCWPRYSECRCRRTA